PALMPVAGRALRELRGGPLMEKVAASLPEFPAPGQVIVIQSLGADLLLESLLALLQRPAVRLYVLRALGARPEPQAAQALLAQAWSPEKKDRREVLRLLEAMPGEVATDAVLKALPEAPAAALCDLVKVLAARRAQIPLLVILQRARHGESNSRIEAI